MPERDFFASFLLGWGFKKNGGQDKNPAPFLKSNIL
jgi:hypothetical protein